MNNILLVLCYSKEIFSFITTTLVSLIAIYTFYRTFVSRKIKFFSYVHGRSIMEGEYISVAIQNWSLSAICIDEIQMIVADKYSVGIKKFDEPFLLEPLKSITIKSDNFSYNDVVSSTGFIQAPKKLQITSGNQIIISKMKRRNVFFRKRKYYQRSTNERYLINGKLITRNMQYIVYIYKNNEYIDQIIIFNGGRMSKSIDEKNSLPLEIMSDKNLIKDYLTPIFKKHDMDIRVDDYSIKAIQTN